MQILIPKLSDYEAINALASEVHQMHVTWQPETFLATTEVITLGELKYVIDNKEILIAKQDNIIVGYIVFKIHNLNSQNPILKPQKEMFITSLCVAKNYRHQHIGTKLLEAVSNYASQLNCDNLALSVNPQNDIAIAFYQKFGMHPKNITYYLTLNKNK